MDHPENRVFPAAAWRWCVLAVVAFAWMMGCTQVRQSDPPRTATELYLLSTAVQNAVKSLSADALQGRSVFVDNNYLSAKEHQYLIAAARARLLMAGARMVEMRENAEIIVEMRTPGMSIDRNEFLLGIPGLPIGQAAGAAGIPVTASTTPELALVKSTKQWGTAGIAYVAYWRETGEIVASSGPHIGRSYREDWYFFGVKKTISDIPPARSPDAIDGVVGEEGRSGGSGVETEASGRLTQD